MKTNTFIRAIVLALLSLCTLLTLNSCNKVNSSSETTTSKIVGQWKWTYEDEDDKDYILYVILTFNEDGSGTEFEYDGGHIDADNLPFYYTYDDTSSVLTIMYLKNNAVYYTQAYKINWINDNTFIINMDEGGNIFKKIS